MLSGLVHPSLTSVALHPLYPLPHGFLAASSWLLLLSQVVGAPITTQVFSFSQLLPLQAHRRTRAELQTNTCFFFHHHKWLRQTGHSRLMLTGHFLLLCYQNLQHFWAAMTPWCKKVKHTLQFWESFRLTSLFACAASVFVSHLHAGDSCRDINMFLWRFSSLYKDHYYLLILIIQILVKIIP